jgi:hypothetical protein
MHNIMTNYVFLLDNLGRIRFAGSGTADDDEITQLVQSTKDVLKENDAGVVQDEDHHIATKSKFERNHKDTMMT